MISIVVRFWADPGTTPFRKLFLLKGSAPPEGRSIIIFF